MHLSAGLLHCLNYASVPLYLWDGSSERVVLFREADVELDTARLEELIASRSESLCLRTNDFQDACSHLLASLSDVVADESLSPAERFQVMQTAVGFEVERTLKAIEPDNYIDLVSNVGTHIAQLVVETDLLPDELFAIARHDSQTFTHVTNVAGYATMLAERLGISDTAELDEIAVGAMLHDIGKRSIPAAILKKTGRLTDEERATIQSHPLLGYQELVGRSDVTHAQRLMVYQHHEHVDGNGYPVKVSESEIHPWARLLAVVDVFDALTGSRPYRQPIGFYEAAEVVLELAGTQFDKEMAKCWASAIKKN